MGVKSCAEGAHEKCKIFLTLLQIFLTKNGRLCKIFPAVPIGAVSAKNLKFPKKLQKMTVFSKFQEGLQPPKPAAPYATGHSIVHDVHDDM